MTQILCSQYRCSEETFSLTDGQTEFVKRVDSGGGDKVLTPNLRAFCVLFQQLLLNSCHRNN